MTGKVMIAQAIEQVVLAARLRIRELEVKWLDEHGEWNDAEHKAEHAELTRALRTVEDAHASLEVSNFEPHT